VAAFGTNPEALWAFLTAKRHESVRRLVTRFPLIAVSRDHPAWGPQVGHPAAENLAENVLAPVGFAREFAAG
jgi:hypothetical protein